MVEKIINFFNAFKSIFIGMSISLKYLFRPAVTMQYPDERWTLPNRYRGALQLKNVMGEVELEYLKAEFQDYDYLVNEKLNEDKLAPCTSACPANVDVRGQNALIAEGNYKEAYLLVRERNIYPAVLGRICHHPCETACKRNYYDENISVRALHRVIAETYFKDNRREKRVASRPEKRYAKVGIIGSGPSGIAAAYDLTKSGYQVTIFEKQQAAGGQLYTAIPKYRLPREILAEEINELAKSGFEIKTGTEIGKDISFNELRKKYDALLIATGLQLSRSLPIPGAELKGILLALPFLYAANFDEKTDLGKRVIVIGGGNVAIDVARSALRLGAKEVKMVCLEARNEMPAYSWEIEEALEEGIEINCSWGPKRFLQGKNGRVAGLEVKQCIRVFDEQGRFNPKFNEEVTTTFEGDTVIVAIGQAADLSFLKDSGVELTERGQIVFDKITQETSLSGVFVSGEVVTGPGSAIGSIASGHQAAISIHRYLSGEDMKANRLPPVALKYEYPPVDLIGIEEERLRKEIPLLSPEIRKNSFVEIEKTLPPELAVLEAERCLRCYSWICVGCRFCERSCPVYAIHVERTPAGGPERKVTLYDFDLSKCMFCGLCKEQCPTKTLVMSKEYELSEYRREKLYYDKDKMLRKINV